MLSECLDRLSHPKMEYYREVYKDSERWNGVDSIAGKTVIVYCEQGFGDIIQFARYIPALKNLGCRIIMHCPIELQRVLAQLYVAMIDKETVDLPPHDYHIPSMSLPFVLNCDVETGPYLSFEGKNDLSGYTGTKIGIAWEGSPDHSNASERNCPLFHFNKLLKNSKNTKSWFFRKPESVRLYILQKKAHDENLVHGCENMALHGAKLGDFMDTAELVNAMDFVVSVDTSVLHLAGAMGKETYGLFSFRCDPRWDIKNWYHPALTMVRQRSSGDWEGVFVELIDMLEKKGRI